LRVHRTLTASTIYIYCIKTLKVLKDVGSYQTQYELVTADAEEEVFAGMESAAAAIVPLSAAEATSMMVDPRAPPRDDPRYLLYSRLLASETSPALYRRVCHVIENTGCDAVAVPGGVKGLERMIFKSLTSYKGDFSKCRVRCSLCFWTENMWCCDDVLLVHWIPRLLAFN
jgi:hypothetical protein